MDVIKRRIIDMLFIWKHETGIKINFDLWKP